jgi:L-2-hydroxyglutarate oxidase LhgO
VANRAAIAIVGGGVIGCAVAWELGKDHDDVFLFEKNPAVTRGENQSSRNSGVIHSGLYYDQETRPEKATLCVTGNRLLYEFCHRYRVPALQTGKLMVATGAEEASILDLYLDRAAHNGVPGVELISRRRIKALEPNVEGEVALLIPSAGIVDPPSLVYRLHALASGQGVHFVTGTEVLGLESHNRSIRLAIRYPDGEPDHLTARVVVNAGGLSAPRLAQWLDPRSPCEPDPIMGESYKFYSHKRPDLAVRGMNIYPTPETVVTPHGSHFTVGVHLTPTFGSLSMPPVLGTTVTVGPKLRPVMENGNSVSETPASEFAQKVRPFFPGLRAEDLIWHQSGQQARLKRHPDFVIRSDSRYPRLINLLGIDSPGLTSCLAVARRVGDMVNALGIGDQ